jgi:hypothetical protein
MGTLSSSLLAALFGLAIVTAMGLMISGISNNPSYTTIGDAREFGVEDDVGKFETYSSDLSSALENIQSGNIVSAAAATWDGTIAIFSLLTSSIELFTSMLTNLLAATGIPFPAQVSAILLTMISLWVLFQIIKLVVQSDF